MQEITEVGVARSTQNSLQKLAASQLMCQISQIIQELVAAFDHHKCQSCCVQQKGLVSEQFSCSHAANDQKLQPCFPAHKIHPRPCLVNVALKTMFGLARCVHFVLKQTLLLSLGKNVLHTSTSDTPMPTEEIREFAHHCLSSQLPLEQRGWTCAFCDVGLPDGIPRSVKDFAIAQHYRTKHPRRDCSLAAVHKARAKRFRKNPAAEPKIRESKKRLSTALSRFQNAAPANPKIAGHDLVVIRPHWETWPSFKVKRKRFGTMLTCKTCGRMANENWDTPCQGPAGPTSGAHKREYVEKDL